MSLSWRIEGARRGNGKVGESETFGKFGETGNSDRSATEKGPGNCRMPFAIWHGTRMVCLRKNSISFRTTGVPVRLSTPTYKDSVAQRSPHDHG